MRPHCQSFAVIAACLLSFQALADDPLTATGSGRGIGLEMTGIDRSLEINGANVQASGAAGGVYAYLQHGATFRGEARLLAGSLEYDTGPQEDSDSITLAEVRATLGQAIENETRLYGGLGATLLSGESPYGGGDGRFGSVYLPVGVARAADIAAGWRVLVTLEGRFLLLGRDEIDNIPSIGDAEFDRSGGWGFEVSAEFRNARAGISIEPFVHMMQPNDSDTENVGGTDVSLSQTDNAAGGVRFIWSF